MIQAVFVTCVLLGSCMDFDDAKVEELLTSAKSQTTDVRIQSLIDLGKIVSRLDEPEQGKVASAIIDGTSDDSSLVRSAASLQIAENSTIINRYLDTYLKSDKPFEYSKACEAIKAIGPEAKIWIPLLKKHVESEDRTFLLGSIHALSAMDRKELLPFLDPMIKALDHKDFNVQWPACRVISKIGRDAKKAGPRLVELQEKGIASARSWASIALGAIGPHEEYDVVALLEKRLGFFYLIDRERALEGLALLGKDAKPAIPSIIKLMNTPEKNCQQIAARAHWKITGDPRPAVDCLQSLVGTMVHGPDSMHILAEIGADAKSAVPDLVKQLRSSEAAHREAAVYALASIGAAASDAVSELKKLKKDNDVLIRDAASKAIKSIETPSPTVDEAKDEQNK